MKAIALLSVVLFIPAVSAHTRCCLPDAHAPIGVMTGHGHAKGETMVSMRYSRMDMSDLIDGSSEKNPADYKADNNKMSYPKDMSMNMYMLGAMHGLGGGYTLSLMQGYLSKEMAMVKVMGGAESEMKVEGLGDTKLALIKKFFDDENYSISGFARLGLPTGDIDGTSNGIRMGYPMQLGAGSYSVAAGATIFRFFDWGSLGAQGSLTKYPERNDEGYRLGDEYSLSAWGSYRLLESLSASLRWERVGHGEISGEDKEMHEMMSTLTETKFSKRRFDFIRAGLNYIAHSGSLAGHRFALEFGDTIAYDVGDYQLRPGQTWTLGWQKAF